LNAKNETPAITTINAAITMINFLFFSMKTDFVAKIQYFTHKHRPLA